MHANKRLITTIIGGIFLLIVIGLALLNLIVVWGDGSLTAVNPTAVLVTRSPEQPQTAFAAAPTLTPTPQPPATIVLTHTAVPPSPTPTNTPTATSGLPAATVVPTNTPLPPRTLPPIPTAAPTVRQNSVLLLDDFESPERLAQDYWINAPGNDVTLVPAGPETAVSGESALQIQYHINQPPPSDYVGLERQEVPSMDWRGYAQICVWVQNDGFAGHLVIQFRETAGEVWKHIRPLQTIQAQHICVPLTDANFVLADHSPRQNRLINLDAVNNFALYLGDGGKAAGVFIIDFLRLEP